MSGSIFLVLLVLLPRSSEGVAPFNYKNPVISSRGDIPELEENEPIVTLDWGLEGIDEDYDEEEEFIAEIEKEEEEEEEEEKSGWKRWFNFRPSRGFSGSFSPSPFFNIDWDIQVILGDSWWEGPNVCQRFEESKEELSQSRTIKRHQVISSSRCDDTDTVYKCTTELAINGTKKTMSVIYECCHGYQRERGSPGCSKKLPPMRNIMATLQYLGLKEMVEAINGVSLEKLLSQKNYTVFAPSNGLLEEYKPIQDQNISVLVVTQDLINLARTLEHSVAAHIVPEFLKTTYMDDEELLPTLSPGDNIRINIYEGPKRLVTANCRPVISSDNLARNGVIHVVNGTLPLVRDSVANIVSSNPDLSMFKTLIGHSGMLSMMKRAGQYTLLAPSNTAFSRLNPYVRDRLMSGDMCVKDVVKNHILPNVICSSILQGSEDDLLTINLVNNYLRVINSDNKLFVEDAQILEKDIMATNGVVHIIDDLLIPNQALTLPEVSASLDATIMTDLIGKANLTDYFIELTNYTAFLPSDDAFGKLPEEELQSVIDDPARLEELIHYHILDTVEEQDDLQHGVMYKTMAGGRQLKVNSNDGCPFLGNKQVTIQCAVIEHADVDTCDGIVHIVDRVLMPPSKTVIEVLKHNPDFSELMRLLQLTDLETELSTLDSFTFLAPTNRAMDRMGRDEMKFLEGNLDHLKSFMKHHIIEGPMCCGDVAATSVLLSSSKTALDGNLLFTNQHAGIVHVNGEPIATCDVVATDGIVHSVDHVLEDAINEYVTPHVRKSNSWKRNGMSYVLEQYMGKVFDAFRPLGNKHQRSQSNVPNTEPKKKHRRGSKRAHHKKPKHAHLMSSGRSQPWGRRQHNRRPEGFMSNLLKHGKRSRPMTEGLDRVKRMYLGKSYHV